MLNFKKLHINTDLQTMDWQLMVYRSVIVITLEFKSFASNYVGI